ncbi:MAG: hypothetical protein QNJ71_04595 [Acidimicrobiia bacterium]|nr:hypothetical protein [Acidimicrobiia bacterium]
MGDNPRTADFAIVRKGYDRSQVDARLAELERDLAAVRGDLEAATGSGLAIGIDEHEALAAEMNTIGREIAEILDAARSAAEGMRTRASSDASEWRSRAKAETDDLVAEAAEQSQSMRASAWNEGSSLLGSAAAEARGIIEAANEEALFVRAEAEREAIRLTGDAKRDREELLRSARSEAEQIIAQARIDSDGVLAAAAQQADLAQERARALEDRRSELLSELETARASIGELEAEIESRRQELEAPEEPEVVEEPADPDARTHHSEDGGSVRIVAPARAVELKPVDADQLVAEVEALRSGEPMNAASHEAAPEPAVTASAAAVSSPEPPASDHESEEPLAQGAGEPARSDASEGEVDAAIPVVEEVSPAPEPPIDDDVEAGVLATESGEDAAASDPGAADPGDGTVAQGDTEPQTAVEPQAAVEPQTEGEPRAEVHPGTTETESTETASTNTEPAEDELGSLFAQLRVETADGGDGPAPASDVTTAPPDAAPPETASEIDEPEPSLETGLATDESDGDASDEPQGEAASRRTPVSQVVEDQAPVGVEASASGAANEDSPGPGDSTIPAQNAALRSIKRTLVDLQNETLEHLRTDADWMPEEDYTDRFGSAFAELHRSVDGGDDPGNARAFAADLFDALSSAIERARTSGGGDRAVASAASKVFRMWRSDESERRVVAAAESRTASV